MNSTVYHTSPIDQTGGGYFISSKVVGIPEANVSASDFYNIHSDGNSFVSNLASYNQFNNFYPNNLTTISPFHNQTPTESCLHWQEQQQEIAQDSSFNHCMRRGDIIEGTISYEMNVNGDPSTVNESANEDYWNVKMNSSQNDGIPVMALQNGELSRGSQQHSPSFSDASTVVSPETSLEGEDTDREGELKVCKVCGDLAGKHVYYGGQVCFSCRAFFRRSAQVNTHSKFKCVEQHPESEQKGVTNQLTQHSSVNCTINKGNRKNCQYCRFVKCLKSGMKVSWVLDEIQKNIRYTKRLQRSKESSKSVVKDGEQGLTENNISSTGVVSLTTRVRAVSFTYDELRELYLLCNSIHMAGSTGLKSYLETNPLYYQRFSNTCLLNLSTDDMFYNETWSMSSHLSFIIINTQKEFRSLCEHDQNVLTRSNIPLINYFKRAIFVNDGMNCIARALHYALSVDPCTADLIYDPYRPLLRDMLSEKSLMIPYQAYFNTFRRSEMRSKSIGDGYDNVMNEDFDHIEKQMERLIKLVKNFAAFPIVTDTTFEDEDVDNEDEDKKGKLIFNSGNPEFMTVNLEYSAMTKPDAHQNYDQEIHRRDIVMEILIQFVLGLSTQALDSPLYEPRKCESIQAKYVSVLNKYLKTMYGNVYGTKKLLDAIYLIQIMNEIYAMERVTYK